MIALADWLNKRAILRERFIATLLSELVLNGGVNIVSPNPQSARELVRELYTRLTAIETKPVIFEYKMTVYPDNRISRELTCSTITTK